MNVEIDDDTGSNDSEDGGQTLNGNTIITITLDESNPIEQAITQLLRTMGSQPITMTDVGTNYSWDYHSDKPLINKITLIVKPFQITTHD